MAARARTELARGFGRRRRGDLDPARGARCSGPTSCPSCPRAIAGDDVVVLVHGFLATAGVFRPLRARLEREAGARVASFSHAPGLGVKRIAQQLASLVDRIPHGTRIHLVGHSLGGIVARWYVQEMGGDARVAQTISIATPFGGAKLAERFRLFVGNDLHAGSDVLTRLRDGAARRRTCPTSRSRGPTDRDGLAARLRALRARRARGPRGARAQSAPLRSRGNRRRRPCSARVTRSRGRSRRELSPEAPGVVATRRASLLRASSSCPPCGRARDAARVRARGADVLARLRRRLRARAERRHLARTTRALALDGCVGVGTPATHPFIVGGVFRAVGYSGFGADMNVSLRLAMQSYCVGDWGVALDLGVGGRFWGGGHYGQLSAPRGAHRWEARSGSRSPSARTSGTSRGDSPRRAAGSRRSSSTSSASRRCAAATRRRLVESRAGQRAPAATPAIP